MHLSATINVSLENSPSAAKPGLRVSQTPQLPHCETKVFSHGHNAQSQYHHFISAVCAMNGILI